MTVPDRGDLVIIDFEAQLGREQTKRRPALVLSSADFNRAFGLAFLAPVTSKPKGHAFEVALPAGSNINGVVMIQQLKSFDWRARNARIAGRVPQIFLGRAIAIVKLVIDAE